MAAMTDGERREAMRALRMKSCVAYVDARVGSKTEKLAEEINAGLCHILDSWPATPVAAADTAPEPARCGGCGLSYGSVKWPCDLVVPNAVWREITPRPDLAGSGGGLLCPNCMLERIGSGGHSGTLVALDIPCAVNGEPRGGLGSTEPQLDYAALRSRLVKVHEHYVGACAYTVGTILADWPAPTPRPAPAAVAEPQPESTPEDVARRLGMVIFGYPGTMYYDEQTDYVVSKSGTRIFLGHARAIVLTIDEAAATGRGTGGA